MDEPESDIQRLWQGQRREEGAINLGEIRQRAERFEQRLRRNNVLAGVLIVAIVGVELRQISIERELLERVGDALTIAAFVYLAYWYRKHSHGPTSPDASAMTRSVDFYRERLARQRQMSDHPWGYLLPFVPGVGLSLFGSALERSAAQNIAIAVFAVTLFVGAAWWHKRSARRLQHELDELG